MLFALSGAVALTLFLLVAKVARIFDVGPQWLRRLTFGKQILYFANGLFVLAWVAKALNS